MKMIMSRLFPFSRGLVHAYWAPNFWALYSFLDRLLGFPLLLSLSLTHTLTHIHIVFLIRRYGWYLKHNISFLRIIVERVEAKNDISSLTSGIIGNTSMIVLPDILPFITLGFVVIAMLPAIFELYKRPDTGVLIRSIVNCTLSSFMFGYHVHEKAILVTLIPLALIANDSLTAAILFIQLSLVGIYSLLPLFTGINELSIKLIIYISYMLFVKTALCTSIPLIKDTKYIKFIFPGTIYILFGIFLFAELFYPSLLRIQIILETISFQEDINISKAITIIKMIKSFEFLPLMITSVINSLFMIMSWLYSYRLLQDDKISSHKLYQSLSYKKSYDDFFPFENDYCDGFHADVNKNGILKAVEEEILELNLAPSISILRLEQKKKGGKRKKHRVRFSPCT